MLSSAIPTRFNITFASGAGGSYIRAVPQASQIGVTAGAASLTDGFPPLNFTPVASGGVPPFGQDINGILNQITAWNQWQAAGGPIFFNSTFSTSIGGYPKGALVTSTAFGTLWLNTAEGNTTDPDGGSPANWQALTPGADVPTGTILMYAANSAPAGFLICDGSAVSRTTYARLFALIGVTYGAGNGSTTFNLPNFLGIFPRGYDSGGSVDPARTFGSTQGHAIQSHNHSNGVNVTTGSAVPFSYGDTSTGVTGTTTAHTDANSAQRNGYTSTGTVAAGSGSGSPAGTFAAETRPINLAVGFIIKT